MYMACIENYNEVYGFGQTIDQAQKNALDRLNKERNKKFTLDDVISFYGMWCIKIPEKGFTVEDVKIGRI